MATSAVEAWASFGLDDRRDELRSTLEQLQQPAGPSARQKALAKLVEQVVSFIALPDPTQALEGAAAAAKRSVGELLDCACMLPGGALHLSACCAQQVHWTTTWLKPGSYTNIFASGHLH